MNRQKKQGFTLSEVVITICIIGIISAIMIPSYVERYQHRARIVAWRHAYSAVANALLLMKMDTVVVTSEKDAVDTLAKYLNAIKICDTLQASEKGCRKNPDDPVKDLKGNVLYGSLDSAGGGCASIVLLNGVTLCLDSFGKAAPLWFDVNGQKGPNRVGYDIFQAIVNFPDFIIMPANGWTSGYGPANSQMMTREYGDGTCQNIDHGFGCSAYYLTHDE